MREIPRGVARGLERLYACYAKRRFVHPDPLEFLYAYDDPDDQEVAGLLAAGLAYGRVGSILKAVRAALSPLGRRPSKALTRLGPKGLLRAWEGFRYRFTTGEEIGAIMVRALETRERWGSIGAFYRAALQEEEGNPVKAASVLSRGLSPGLGRDLLPDPMKGSASKRLFLYLRWMVRRDEVDPGPWSGFASPRSLIVPLDTHLHRIACTLGLLRRRSPDLKAALEVTEALRAVCPEDPVRYDFVLTRFGINPDLKGEDPWSSW